MDRTEDQTLANDLGEEFAYDLEQPRSSDVCLGEGRKEGRGVAVAEGGRL